MEAEAEFNHDLVWAHKFPETTVDYSERDVAIYALGVGVCAWDASDAHELKYVYHKDGQQFIQVLPTFASLFSLGSITNNINLPGIKYDPNLLLHAQHYLELNKPLPSSGSIYNKVRLVGLHDKGKAAVVEVETKSYEKESGELLSINRATAFLRGAGCFSNSSSPYSHSTCPRNKAATIHAPISTKPFAVLEDRTAPSQALLYRLSGDYNPLHSDPILARQAGFSSPILHGLCVLGYAARAIIKCVCGGESSSIKTISARFVMPVNPGETLITKMWLEECSRVIFESKVKESNHTVLIGCAELRAVSSL